jgi:hypothetical protein
MKLALLPPCLWLAVAGATGGEGELETIVKDKLKCLREVTAALHPVKDGKSAQAALARLEASLERLIVCDETLADRRVIEQLRTGKLAAKYEPQLADAEAALHKELERLAKEPAAHRALAEDAAWKRWQAARAEVASVLTQDRVSKAKVDIVSLEKAVQAFNAKHGRFPDSLKQLTENDGDNPAMLKVEALIDPWGQAYQFEPNNLNPKTRTPLIYSQGPPGQNMPIRNWDGPGLKNEKALEDPPAKG